MYFYLNADFKGFMAVNLRDCDFSSHKFLHLSDEAFILLTRLSVFFYTYCFFQKVKTFHLPLLSNNYFQYTVVFFNNSQCL